MKVELNIDQLCLVPHPMDKRSLQIYFHHHNQKNQLGCEPFDLTNEPNWPRSVDPDDLPPGEVPSLYVLLLVRGVCSFVQKVRNAQNLGASVVIIMNRPDAGGEYLYYMADDGTGDSITIPSIFIRNSDGKLLNDTLQTSNITLAMSWSFEAYDDQVQWQLWTSSRDPSTFAFKKNFGIVEQLLGNSTMFTPHYEFRTYGFRSGNNPNCWNLGRYCAPDPDATGDLTGRDVVKENLRQVCLYRELVAHNTTDTWWKYVSLFETECSLATQWRTSDCGDNIIRRLGQNLDEVNTCINQAPLAADTSVEHPVIRDEMLAFQRAGIFALPTIVINEEHYRGTAKCDPPIDISTCGILAAICSGFTNGTEPTVCHSSPGCGLGIRRDACGVCGGDGEFDKCGICLSPKSPAFQRIMCINEPAAESSGSNGASVGAVIGIVLGAIILVAIAIVIYMKRQKKEINEGMDSMLRQYLPMDSDDGINNTHATRQP